MGYHITNVTNDTSRSISIMDSSHNKRSTQVAPNLDDYQLATEIELNEISGDPSYAEAAADGIVVFTSKDNYCFWRKPPLTPGWENPVGNVPVGCIGEAAGSMLAAGVMEGDLRIHVLQDGTATLEQRRVKGSDQIWGSPIGT